jgi:hypothetical protein
MAHREIRLRENTPSACRYLHTSGNQSVNALGRKSEAQKWFDKTIKEMLPSDSEASYTIGINIVETGDREFLERYLYYYEPQHKVGAKFLRARAALEDAAWASFDQHLREYTLNPERLSRDALPTEVWATTAQMTPKLDIFVRWVYVVYTNSWLKCFLKHGILQT